MSQSPRRIVSRLLLSRVGWRRLLVPLGKGGGGGGSAGAADGGQCNPLFLLFSFFHSFLSGLPGQGKNTWQSAEAAQYSK